MSMLWCRSFAVVIWAHFLIGNAQAQELGKLTGCASQTPPFVMMQAGVGSTGYSVDYFRGVAKSLGRTGVIRELPWARCLRDVATGHVDIAVDAYEDTERHLQFLYSAPYYTLTPQVFFRSNLSGKDFPVNTVVELAARSGCGVHEYTYEHYGLEAKRMDRGAKSDKHMLMMLLAGRCDYAVEELEYIIGGRKNDKDWPDESALQSYRPEWAKAPQLHYLIGRKHPDAQRLQSSINMAIEGMEKSGEAKALRAKYFADIDVKRSKP